MTGGRRDNIHTTETGDTAIAPHTAADQTSDERTILFWDKNQFAPAAPTDAGYGQLFAGSTTELWINSVDYSGVAEGLPFCDTCDNVLTEWNYFDQICSDKDECKMQDTLYDAYIKDQVGTPSAASAQAAPYEADVLTHCNTEYFPTTNVRRNNIMPAGSSIQSGAAGFAQHMDCHNRGPYNSDHGFKCECPPGSELNSAGTQCVDINECRLGQHTCGWLPCIDYCAWGSSDGTVPNARWNGAYSLCGYDVSMTMGDFDILAYEVDPATGDYVAITDFTGATLIGSAVSAAAAAVANYRPGGGYTCQCPEGLRWNETTRTCDDINECIGKLIKI